jgi:hypothetical protein
MVKMTIFVNRCGFEAKAEFTGGQGCARREKASYIMAK